MLVELHEISAGRNIIGSAIICSPTGFMCTFQAGGAVCQHPQAEGSYIYIYTSESLESFQKVLDDLNDCAWGCNINMIGYADEDIEEAQEEIKVRKLAYAQTIDKFLKEELIKYNSTKLYFTFDYDRIDEVMEGWWPVLIEFKTDYFIRNSSRLEGFYVELFKGYLHFGNCD